MAVKLAEATTLQEVYSRDGTNKPKVSTEGMDPKEVVNHLVKIFGEGIKFLTYGTTDARGEKVDSSIVKPASVRQHYRTGHPVKTVVMTQGVFQGFENCARKMADPDLDAINQETVGFLVTGGRVINELIKQGDALTTLANFMDLTCDADGTPLLSMPLGQRIPVLVQRRFDIEAWDSQCVLYEDFGGAKTELGKALKGVLDAFDMVVKKLKMTPAFVANARAILLSNMTVATKEATGAKLEQVAGKLAMASNVKDLQLVCSNVKSILLGGVVASVQGTNGGTGMAKA